MKKQKASNSSYNTNSPAFLAAQYGNIGILTDLASLGSGFFSKPKTPAQYADQINHAAASMNPQSCGTP